jgi:hypothetical protein
MPLLGIASKHGIRKFTLSVIHFLTHKRILSLRDTSLAVVQGEMKRGEKGELKLRGGS